MAPPTLEGTFGDYHLEWLDESALRVKATTAARNRTCITRYVLTRKKVRNLAPADFRSPYRELADHGRRDGPRSRRALSRRSTRSSRPRCSGW